jgi:hypothetical protein
MLKKTLVGTAAAAFIAAGATVATTGAASASGVSIHTPGFSVGFYSPGFFPKPLPPRKVCEPVFKTVKWWQWGKLHSSVVKVGENCHWVSGNPGPFPPKPYPLPKPGPWAGQQGPHW